MLSHHVRDGARLGGPLGTTDAADMGSNLEASGRVEASCVSYTAKNSIAPICHRVSSKPL